jgi:type IV secretory pathway VirB2 component (pilin)
MEETMENLVESISGFIGKVVTVILISGGICLLAGEIRLAALKKASKGSLNLSLLTSQMTGVRYP